MGIGGNVVRFQRATRPFDQGRMPESAGSHPVCAMTRVAAFPALALVLPLGAAADPPVGDRAACLLDSDGTRIHIADIRFDPDGRYAVTMSCRCARSAASRDPDGTGASCPIPTRRRGRSVTTI